MTGPAWRAVDRSLAIRTWKSIFGRQACATYEHES